MSHFEPVNFHYTSDSELSGGQKTHYKDNVIAIRILKEVEAQQRPAFPQEQETLSRYVGWGGIPQAFDEKNSGWRGEFAELKELLTPEEYAAARASTLTAFYTPPAVIQTMYAALEQFGFSGGNILEPSCGTGRFFGYLPEKMKETSNLCGVELDSVTGRIAALLYPQADIHIKGFEKTELPDNFFDAAVGNIPYGNFGLSDPLYDRRHFLIHDYFFAKTLDMLRPGGVLIFLTSKGTMDKADPTVRKYLAERAELIGAIRLPNTVMKAEANTEVTADLLFLQKRECPIVTEPDWVGLSYTENNIPVNAYFAEHPEMMLGTMAYSIRMYGNEKDTTLAPNPGEDWREKIKELTANLQAQFTSIAPSADTKEIPRSIPASPDVKNFSYTMRDGAIYYRENSVMFLQEVQGVRAERMEGMIGIRDALHEVIRTQNEDAPEEQLFAARERLNRFYDSYVKKYGVLSGRGNALAFREDADFPLLLSLESVRDDGTAEKADIFTKRTIQPAVPITHTDNVMDALAVSLDQKGCVDFPSLCSLTGKTEDAVLTGLGTAVFKDPVSENYVTAEEYLSGNVRKKLSLAEDAAQLDSAYQRNAEALRLIQPERLSAAQINIRLGSPLVTKEHIQRFIRETLSPPYYLNKLEVVHLPSEAIWHIGGVPHRLLQANNDVISTKQFGTGRIDAYELLEISLNLRTPTIRDKIEDHYVVNQKETTAARERQKRLERTFKDWIYRDPERRQAVEDDYNERFNSIRPRTYDGSHLTFPGMSPFIQLNDHQKNAVARILHHGNTLLAHSVGAGKTYTMIAAGMKCRQLGLIAKPVYVVPGHLVDQWGGDILRLYPGANVLLATKHDFEKANRRRFISRIATGEYDAVVIAQSSFEKIPVNPERLEQVISGQIDELAEAMESLSSEQSGQDWTVKQMERTKKSLQTQLERLASQAGKDSQIYFDDLGVDQIFADESHYYKNLFVPTKMTNVAGIGQQKAQKASDLLAKCGFLYEKCKGMRGVVFASATPISNSMSELFTNQTYLQPEALHELGIRHFDAWAAQFGETASTLELTPDGTRYRYKTRFAHFVNLPELMNLFSEVADIQTADMLRLPIPELEGGKAQTIVAKPSPDQQALVLDIVECFERIHAGLVEPYEDNALKETHRGRCGALDMRILDSACEDFPGSKINLATETIFSEWQNSEATKGTQMVFCDLSVPNGKKAFNVYDDMREKLVNKGVPREEIRFIHEASTEQQKESLFADMRSGKARILFGSTARMGTGTNVQQRMIALHHLDAPWRPADIEQRDGRILRQGNNNKTVSIFRYVTEGTFDAYSWQILEQKQRFISQVMGGHYTGRSAEDIDAAALDYATVKMLSTNDPRVKEREELHVRVAELEQLKAQHNSERYAMENETLRRLPERISWNKEHIRHLTADISLRDANHKESFEMTLGGTVYRDKQEAGQELLKLARTHRKYDKPLRIGSYRGFDLEVSFSGLFETHSLILCGSTRHRVELGINNIQLLDNELGRFEETAANCRGEIAKAEEQTAALKGQLALPWEYAKEYEEKSEALAKLDIALNLDFGAESGKEQVVDELANQEAVQTETPTQKQPGMRL